MRKPRRNHSAAFKARVALEAHLCRGALLVVSSGLMPAWIASERSRRSRSVCHRQTACSDSK
jgi:hypothetical protein